MWDDLRERLKDSEGRRLFIVLVLFGGLIFFQLVGYDYTGLVSKTTTYAIDTTKLSDSITGVINIFTQGFAKPIFDAVGDTNEPWALKIALWFILFALINWALSKGQFDEKTNKIIAMIISLIGVAFLPKAFILGLGQLIALGIILGFIVAVVLLIRNWDKGSTDKAINIAKAVLSLIFLILLGSMSTWLEGALQSVKDVNEIAIALGTAVLAGMFLFYLYKTFTEGGSSSGASEISSGGGSSGGSADPTSNKNDKSLKKDIGKSIDHSIKAIQKFSKNLKDNFEDNSQRNSLIAQLSETDGRLDDHPETKSSGVRKQFRDNVKNLGSLFVKYDGAANIGIKNMIRTQTGIKTLDMLIKSLNGVKAVLGR